MQHRAADQLDVEMPHVDGAPSGLPHDGKGLGQQFVQRLACGQPLAEFSCFAANLLVGEFLESGLEYRDLLDERAQLLEFAFVLGADDFG